MDTKSTKRRLAVVDAPDDFVPGWYAVASSRELRKDEPLALERFGVRWALYRHSGGVAAMEDRCPHRQVALSAGRVCGDRLVCPFHGFAFDPSGACRHIPAHGEGGHIPSAMRVAVRPVREAHGFIFMWWGRVPEVLPEIDWFHEELAGCYRPSEFWRDSAIGLSRNIENQLDFTHLPFVHQNTIGRLVGDAAMEINVHVEGRRLRAFRRGFPDAFVELRLPNIWLNKIGARAFGMLAFAPIDRQRTRLYVRYYQASVTVPLVADVLGWVMSQSNKWIIGEDLRVVDTHRPKISPPLDGSEVLVPSDAPIIAYRKLRRQLTADAAELVSDAPTGASRAPAPGGLRPTGS